MIEKSRAVRGLAGLLVIVAILANVLSDDAVVTTGCYLGVLFAATIGAWIGARRAPREQRRVRQFMALAIALTAVGGVLSTIDDLTGAEVDLSVADTSWFAGHLALAVALWILLVRGRWSAGVDVDSVIDAVTIVVVGMLLFWSTSVDAIVTDQSVSLFQRTVGVAYPVADVLLLALAVRVLMSDRARAALGACGVVGLGCWLAADIPYLLDHGSSGAQSILEAGWMAATVLIALAVWRTEKAPDPSASSQLGGWFGQVMLAVGPLIVPPALELATDLRGQHGQHHQLFWGTAILVTLAFVRTARLIGAKERTQRELEIARDAALEASRAKSTFLATMSHEIRTPLTTVLATAELLEDTPLDQSQLRLVARMQRSGQVLRTLVDRILDFSPIESGQLQLAVIPFDLVSMIDDVADHYASQADQRGIAFECHVDARVPRAVVGDPVRVLQILTNVLDNALKFTDRGQISLTVRTVALDDGSREGGDGRDVIFLVADTGIGMHDRDRELIFQPFHQLDGSVTRRHGGKGLGLAICKELTEMMGGSIAVQSQFGVGSTFAVVLPLVEPPNGEDHYPEDVVAVGRLPDDSWPAGTAPASGVGPRTSGRDGRRR